MSRYSYVASRASTARPNTSPPPRATASLRSLYGSGGTSKSWARPWRSSTSTRSTFRPPDAVRDEAEEPAGRSAVAHPVVERQRQLGDLADCQLSVDHPGLVDDPTDPEQGGLGVVDDRGGAVDAEDPVVVERDGAAGEVVGLELATAGERGEAAELGSQLERGLVERVPDDGHDKTAFGLGREAEIDVRELDDLLAVHAGVELRVPT